MHVYDNYNYIFTVHRKTFSQHFTALMMCRDISFQNIMDDITRTMTSLFSNASSFLEFEYDCLVYSNFCPNTTELNDL